jgi:diguanylate cyclase (GGDEF)-like protein
VGRVVLGLRLKVVFVVASAVGLIQAMVGFGQLKEDANHLRSEAARRGHQVQRALAVPCSVSLANREMEVLDAILWRFSESEGRGLDILSVAVLDLGGRVVAHTNPKYYGHLMEGSFFEEAIKSNLELEQPGSRNGVSILQLSLPIQTGRRWGTMTMEISLAEVEQEILRRRTRVVITTGGVTLFSAFLLYLLISRLVLMPLTLLSETAKRVAEGHLDARVPKRTGKDEISLLSNVFNEMTNELQSYTAGLEDKVAERTLALEGVNNALELSNEELELAVEKLGHLARTDGLTGLLNRRALNEALQVETRRTERHERPFSLLMIDVDYFKKFNDAFGHPAGDRLLVILGETLRENLRAMDVVARYGGEEFAVILGETSGLEAVRVADKLRLSVREKIFREPGDGKPAGRATISIGVATYPVDASNASGLISQADQALYLAKEAGRDLVVSCTVTPQGEE